MDGYYYNNGSYRNGWICPKCGKVYSPGTWECWSCNSKLPVHFTISYMGKVFVLEDGVWKEKNELTTDDSTERLFDEP